MNGASECQESWIRFLAAVKSGRIVDLDRAATSIGCGWVENWLNPEQDGYEERCAAVAKGWSKRRVTVVGEEDNEVRATLSVPFWTKAFFFFGPGLLIVFRRERDDLKVDGISFSGD
jgi:hypothetical protein